MNVLPALLVAAALAAVPARAQDPAAQAVAPRISCDQPVYNFGRVDNSQTVEHEFVLRNTGTVSLEISAVRPSCGCTVANISERSVPPGGETRILSRLNLQGRSGPQHKAIVIDSNDPQQPQFILTMQGEATVAIQVMPDRVIFGQVSPGQNPGTQIQVTGSGDPAFKVLGVESSDPKVTATLETAEEGRAYRVNISAPGPLPEGQLNANVRITTDHPARPVIDIPVVAVVVGDIVVAPQEIILAPQGDESQIRYIIVRSSQGQPFKVLGVETPDPSVTVDIMPFGDNGYRLQVNNLRATEAIVGKNLIIRTDMPSRTEVAVPIKLIGG